MNWPNILITGRGTSGSWRIRGEQLGRVIDARVKARASAGDLQGVRLAVLVKRPEVATLHLLHTAGLSLVWDVVDAWPQPAGNAWDRAACLAWARQEVRRIRPMAIVAATQAMAADFAEFGVPVLAVPHHAMPWARPVEIREQVRNVAYEGGVQYLGRWEAVLQAECNRRGWRLCINPPSLAVADIVVALRDHAGHGARHWKSNVKLANAQGWGLPCVLNREAGYQETASGAECWADTAAELAQAFDSLTQAEDRRARAAVLAAAAPKLENVAAPYLEWLRAL